MTAFALSLRALKHPLTVLSIGLLLLNDHFLKAAIPSWFTGKLSDFAGLFFFPFLLAALMAFPLEAMHIHPRRIMQLATAFTALWFVLLKTVPAVNALTITLLGRPVGGTPQIRLDPSDLIALPMAALGYKLWTRLEHPVLPASPSRWAYAALGVAALATLATSPTVPPPIVNRVAIIDSTLYASLNVYYIRPETLTPIVSTTGGVSWEYLSFPSEVVSQTLALPVAFPKSVCSEQDVAHCYRITGNETVEESLDGGQNWRTAWQIPWGRRKFMERSLYAAPMASDKFSGGIQLGPYDLALGYVQGSELLVVAAGNEGVIVHTPTGEWRRYGVLGAAPTPYAQQDSGSPLAFIANTIPEIILSLLAALLILVGFMLWGWAHVLTANNLTVGRSPNWAIRPAVIGIALCVGLTSINLMIWLRQGVPHGEGDRLFVGWIWMVLIASAFGWYLTVPATLTLAGGLFWAGLRVRHAASNLQLTGMVTHTAWLTAAGVFFGPTLCFSLWAYGVIPIYEMALGLSVGILVLCVWGGGRTLISIDRVLLSTALTAHEPARREQ